MYQALRNLGALPLGQAPGSDENAFVNGLVGPMVAYLEKKDVYYLPNTDAIPEEAFLPLAHVLAWQAASGFGQHKDQDLYGLFVAAQQDLEIIEAERPYKDVLEIQAF